MKGWEIFAHSVRLVFTNLSAALRISLVPYAISGFALLYFGSEAFELLATQDPERIAAEGGDLWSGLLVYGIIAIITSLWIAVSWHRYVLLEEYPTGWVPGFHGGPIARYFLQGFLLCLLIVFVVLVAGLVVGGLLAAVGFGLLASILVMALGSYLFYRFCAVLPAAALGQRMTFAQAWDATRGHGGDIALLVVLVLIGSQLIQLPTLLGNPGSIVGIAYNLLANWIATLIGASVLTTFYGHFVEGRPID